MWAVGSRLQSHLGHLELFVQLLNGRGLGDICRVSKMQHLVVGGETTIEELVPTSSRAREGRALNKMAESLLSNELEDLWLNPITQLLDWFRLEHVLIQQLAILFRLRYLLVAEIKQLLLEDLEAGQRGASIEEHRGDLFGHYSDHLLKIEDGGSHLAPGLEEELDGDAEHLLEGLFAPDENGNVLIAYLGGLFADAKQLTQDLGEGDAGVSKGALAVRVGKEQSGEGIVFGLGKVHHTVQSEDARRRLVEVILRIPTEEPQLLPVLLGHGCLLLVAGVLIGECPHGEHAYILLHLGVPGHETHFHPALHQVEHV